LPLPPSYAPDPRRHRGHRSRHLCRQMSTVYAFPLGRWNESHPCGSLSIRSSAARCALSCASSASTNASTCLANRSLIEVKRLAASTFAFCKVCGLRLTVTFCFRIGAIRVLSTQLRFTKYFTCGRGPVEAALRRRDGGRKLRNPKLVLQLLQSDSFGFRIDEQHNKELQCRHGGKKRKRQTAGILCQNRKEK
jgi:hypothetical protein